jgi:hypothetical protein
MPSSHKKVTNIISGIDIPNPEIVNENDGVHASNALALLTHTHAHMECLGG